MLPVVCFLAFLAILYRALEVAARSSYRTWAGERWRFWALTLAFALVSAGALGVALRVPGADALLAVGVALYLAADRRGRFSEKTEARP